MNHDHLIDAALKAARAAARANEKALKASRAAAHLVALADEAQALAAATMHEYRCAVSPYAAGI